MSRLNMSVNCPKKRACTRAMENPVTSRKINFCTNCGTSGRIGENYCSGCGNPSTTNSERLDQPLHRPSARKPGKRIDERARRNPEEQKSYLAMARREYDIAVNEKEWRFAKRAGCTILAFVACASVMSIWRNSHESWVLVLIAFILSGVMMQRRSLSPLEYLQLATVKDAGGHKPMCVFCGHHGLYTHGQYRSSTTFHDCSKCGETLYTS